VLSPRRAPILLALLLGVVGCSGDGCSRATQPPQAAAPGGSSIDAGLRRRLDEALRARGPGYVPRTRHLTAQGAPRYTNRLLLEASPYLQQHAHNPVDWFPWGDEAFARARATGRPVFLSIGYSTCHWCHVMEEESFEDEEIAAYLNAHYVAIKVDREERPDLDAIYMTALQSLTGGGGWPMSLWLTPGREVFVAGTYFPPRDGARGAHRGFLSLLAEQAERFTHQPAEVAAEAAQVSLRVRESSAPTPPGDLPGTRTLRAGVAQARKRYDPVNGGKQGAPKFPSSLPLELLLRAARRDGDAGARSMVVTTLEKMRDGGLHDQLGGGFHRYSTDKKWLVPHFEKMLYDNALLALDYLEAGRLAGDEGLLATARETLDYLLRELRGPDGLFFAATDADSVAPSGRREEGYFFTWTPAEIGAVLGAAEARAPIAYFAVTPGGNLDGRSVLSTPRPRDAVASSLGMARNDFDQRIETARSKLLDARARRPPPLRDDKALVSWNGLVVRALARAAIVLGEPRYAEAAVRAAGALCAEIRAGRPLPHEVIAGQPRGEGFLDDHAALALALVEVFELTADPRWLADARLLLDRLDARHADRARGGYYQTPEDAETLLAREKPIHDGPVPSGNALATLAELRLAGFTGDERLQRRAEATLRAFAAPIEEYPSSFEHLLVAVDLLTDAPREVAIVLPAGSGAMDPAARPLLDVLRRVYAPHLSLVVASEEALAGPLGEQVTWARGKPTRGGKATAYVCERGSCKLPTSDPAQLAIQLGEVRGW
jgi:hypothetical protein